MKVARAKGRLRGKQPKLSPMQEAHLVKLYRAGAHTVSELEELFGITRSTVYRAPRRAAGARAPRRRTLPRSGPWDLVAVTFRGRSDVGVRRRLGTRAREA
jgi:DNA-binding MarR family transcriptional regulator